MSRHGYVDDGDLEPLEWGRWHGSVLSAIRGKRGQAFLREMIAALDAMPEKRLVRSELVTKDGDVCAMGCVLAKRGTDVKAVDPEDYGTVANVVGLAESMTREIAYENDEGSYKETPEQRWARMRNWAEKNLRPSPAEPPEVSPDAK